MSSVDSLKQARVFRRQKSWSQIYFGVAVTTLASLLLELSLTRIFSVVFYYHFAFLAISIALFGLGVGGILSYVVARWRGELYLKLGALALADSLAVVVALEFLLSRPADLNTVDIGLVYFTCALPFLLSGTIVASAISDNIQCVDRVYFFDLMGAAGGCVLLVPLLNWIGGPNTLLVSASLFALAAAIWFNVARLPKGRVMGVSLALVLVALITYNSKSSIIELKYAKQHALKNEEFHQWNSFSRVALVKEPGSETRNIVIDGDAETGVANFDFSALSHREREYLAYHGPGFPYILRPGGKNPRNRPRRRMGCCASACRRKHRCDRRGDQPDHRRCHHAEKIPAIQPVLVPPAGRPYCR